MRFKSRSAPWTATLAASLVVFAAMAQQGRHCDPALPLDTQSANGYRDRGDRCEGQYRSRNVRSSDIVLVAFDVLRQDLAKGPTVRLKWGNVATDSELWLTALNVRRMPLYRMDRHTSRGEHEFRWDTSLATGAGVEAADLGAILTTHLKVGGAQQQIYLPVTTGLAASDATPHNRRVQFRLGASFQKLSWRLSTYTSNRESVETTSKWTPFRGRLDRDKLVYVDVTLQAGRCFLLELSGKEDNGLPAAEEFYVCEPAN